MRDQWRQHRWFHAIDPRRRTRYARPLPPEDTHPNYTLFGFYDLIRHADLSLATCVDVGTMDGLAAFVLAGLGAKRVMACDLAHRESFIWAREQLGYDKIEYRTPVSGAMNCPQSLANRALTSSCWPVCSTMSTTPLSVLVSLRQSLWPGGLLFVETVFLRYETKACMRFNPSDDKVSRLPTKLDS